MSPAQNTTFYNKVAQFRIAEDSDDKRPNQGASRKSPLRVGKENTDSGYHGIPEDEMDVDSQQAAAMRIAGADPFHAPAAAAPILETLDENIQSAERPTNSDSFVSAIEDIENAENDAQEDDDATVPDDEMHIDTESAPQPVSSPLQEIPVEEDHEESGNWQVENEPEAEPMDAEEDLEVKSPSDAYSPEKPLLRKSSLNFAALPAREPLTAKRSIGPRGSHFDNGVLGRLTHGKSFGASQPAANQDEDDEEEEQENDEYQESRQVQNKFSTQTLHERIAALGQTKEPRMSKSIPMSLANSGYPVLPKDETAKADENLHGDDKDENDDDDDWIAPIEKSSRPASGVDEHTLQKATEPEEPVVAAPVVRHSPSKYLMAHQKSSSTVSLASPNKLAMAPENMHKKAFSVSNPNLSHAVGTSTPMSSPGGKKFADGPLSASKARLYSVLKSAKGMFASSANASAQAKMEGSSSPLRAQQDVNAGSVRSRMPGGFDDIPMAPKPAARPVEGRKTRSSTENEKKKDRAMDDLEKVRQKEREKAAGQKVEREKLERANSLRQEKEKERLAAASRAESQRSAAEDQSEAEEAAPAAKSAIPAGKLRAPGRLARPTKPASTQSSKPAPQLIRVASQSQRLGSVQPSGPNDSTASTSTRATTRAGSAQPASKAAPASAARVRALEAAARKKEQDEKAAQRKAEQKRELERKRAAKAEEEKRAEQERRAAEQQRLQEAKLAEQQRIQESRLAAQRQAEQRKLEQQRLQAAQEKARTAELAAALEQEKKEKLQAQASYPRGDVGGTLRQLAKQEIARPITAGNQAKSGKRAMADDDEQQQRPGLQRGPASYQQQDNKRRKTLEDDDENTERHSVMAPPKRPSNMRKVCIDSSDEHSIIADPSQETFSKFPNGYTHAPPPATHHAQNMYKATVSAQHQLQHGPKGAPMHPNDMLKLSNARIPFADNANPPGPSSSAHYVQDGAAKYVPSSSASAFKTPGRPASAAPKSAIKSSPMYQNGENIALPEIATDSEDESDSEDENATGGFRAPSWVASPALRDLLTSQQLVDPESVFGPIATLNMDEVFKNGKNGERLKRFRDRGSSARWVESGDAVTQDEKKRDREARARVVKEGGWRFGQDSA